MSSAQPGFMKLTAWQRADDLASSVFVATERLDQRHRWLGLQMVRAAVSVPANIAEGYGRGYVREYLRFVDIARGSLSEVEYYIHFMGKQGLLPESEIEQLRGSRAEAGRTLHGLWNSLKIKGRSTLEPSVPQSGIREVPAPSYEVEV